MEVARGFDSQVVKLSPTLLHRGNLSSPRFFLDPYSVIFLLFRSYSVIWRKASLNEKYIREAGRFDRSIFKLVNPAESNDKIKIPEFFLLNNRTKIDLRIILLFTVRHITFFPNSQLFFPRECFSLNYSYSKGLNSKQTFLPFLNFPWVLLKNFNYKGLLVILDAFM